MTATSKNVYFDVLDDIVDKYNNTYHRTINMKPIYVGDDSFAEYNEESNETDSKFKVGDHVRISKYKNIFAKGYAPNWSEEILEFRIEKVIKMKGNKLYDKWEGCNNSFNSWIDKKDLIKLELSNYATKTDLKNVTHVDAC